MSVMGDVARESIISALCEKLKKKIEEHPEAAPALKELGVEMIEQQVTAPDGKVWSGFEEDYTFFKE